jgi:hypothetical protein
MKLNLMETTLSVGLLAAGLTAGAAPLQRADLPAEPVWVAHFDVDALRPTTIGQYLQAEMDKPEAQAKLAAFQSIFSVDLRTQLHGVTLYSTGTASTDGILLVYADFDPDKLITLAKAANGYQSTTYKTHTIHNWIDEKKKPRNGVQPRVYAAIQGARVIFGQREQPVAQALDVLDGAASRLSASTAFPEMGAAGDTSFIEAAARKLDLPGSDPNAAIFRLSKLARFQISEAQGQVNAALTLEANDEETAGQMLSIAQGLVGLMKLQKEKPEAVKFADALIVKQDGARVVATLAMPATDFVEIMKADAARRAAKKAQREQAAGDAK